MNNLIVTSVLMLALSSPLVAQDQISVKGTVKDQTGLTLPGVNVLNVTNNTGTITNIDGNYVLSAKKGDELRFSYIGMKDFTIKVTSDKIDVVLREASEVLEDIVVIGYGTSKKKDLTGAVASIKLENSPVMSMPNNNVLESLKGSLPGVNISMSASAGGTPGFSIRGQNSINASTAPLLVVDGIIGGNFAELNPQDIASIDILKDASSTAVYGSRAANGVILVTTKRGKSEKPRFNFSMNYGIQSWTRKPKMMNGEQYIKFRQDWAKAEGRDGVDLEPEYLLLPKEYEAYKQGSQYNWFDETTQAAPTQSYQLSVSGASDKFNYYISGNYLNQDGLLVGDKFTRSSFLAKLEANLNDYVKAGVNLSGNIRDYSGVTPDLYTGTYLSPWGFMNSTFSGFEDKLERYPSGGTTWDNPLWSTYGVDDKEIYQGFSAKGFLDIKLPWIKGLTWKLNGAYNINHSTVARFNHEERYVNTLKENDLKNPSQFLKKANGSSSEGNSNSWLMNQILNYNRQFGEHKIDLTFMSERQASESYGTKATASDFEQAGTTVLGFNALEKGNAEKRGVDTWKSRSAQLAYMFRVNYVWKDRYHVSASWRRDGFSAFSEGHKYGNFRSAAVAWTATEEDFMKNDVMNYLKLRLSYGENGNPSIGSYSTFPKVGEGGYIFGSDYMKTMYQTSLANKTLGWERTNAFNVGMDFGFFDNRLSGNIEYYRSHTHDLLVTRRLPSTSGYGSILDNMGEVANWGIELGLHSVNIETKEFQWTSDFSFWLNRNKIVSLYGLDTDGDGVEDDDLSNGWFIGKSLGAVYTYETDGIVQESDTEYMEKYNMKAGDVKIVDQNNNGKIDADDKKIIGYTKPNFNMNLRNTFIYKNWQLYFSLDYIAGGGKNNYYIANNEKGFNPALMPSANWLAEEYWTPETPSNVSPRANYENKRYGLGFYQSRSFVRLQDITLSYQFSEKLLNKTKFLTNARVFVSGKNLLTLTGWRGMDPEAGQRIGEGSPSFKTYSFGVNVSF